MWKTPKLTAFMRGRNAHMNAEMERKKLELPDAFDLIPADVMSLPADHRRALDDEIWAVTGANIAYMNDQWRHEQRLREKGLLGDGWEQLELPITWPIPLMVASGAWCAPSDDNSYSFVS